MKRYATTAAIATFAFVAGGATAVRNGATNIPLVALAQAGKQTSSPSKSAPVKTANADKAGRAGTETGPVRPTAVPARSERDEDSYRGVRLGTNASLGNWRPFPADSYWNTPIDHVSVDDRSKVYIEAIGGQRNLHPDFGGMFEGRFIGIPYVVVSGNTPRVPVTFGYADESDHELYPIPANPPIEGYPAPPDDGDRHLLIIDRDNWRLFELIGMKKQGSRWSALSGAVFSLNEHPNRPVGWTSADAAGLPILPALVKWEEVYVQKEIRHALRFTVPKTQRAYVAPARHFASASKDPTLPPMGIRLRLKASYDTSRFSPECQVILKALKRYGMILADNGAPWFIQGAPDPRWNGEKIAELKQVKGSDLEVIQITHIIK